MSLPGKADEYIFFPTSLTLVVRVIDHSSTNTTGRLHLNHVHHAHSHSSAERLGLHSQNKRTTVSTNTLHKSHRRLEWFPRKTWFWVNGVVICGYPEHDKVASYMYMRVYRYYD